MFKNNFAVKDPIIVVGMHRSGTTMLTKLLENSGVFFGNRKDDNCEDLFFLRLNEWILRNAHTTWDCPEMFEHVDDEYLDTMANFVRSRISGPSLIRYTGVKNYQSIIKKIKSEECSWGWKDPRNCITLPIWQKIFPNCKVVHIYRNPIDVAISLRKRSLGFQTDNSFRNYLKRSMVFGSVKYHESLRVRDVKQGIKIWEWYTNKCLSTDGKVIHIKFENFLVDPSKEWARLNKFLGTDFSLEKTKLSIDASRAYAFKNSGLSDEVIDSLRDNHLIKTLGY